MKNNTFKNSIKHIWYPYTQMKDLEENPPVLIVKAVGIKLFDKNGKFYYDTISSWWANTLGHNNKRLNNSIKKQLNNFAHILFAGFTHNPAILLAEKIVKIVSSNMNKVFFSDNGSTAIEVALKMSIQYWYNLGYKNKTKIVSFDKAYHGDTIGCMSVSGVSMFNEMFSSLFFDNFKIKTPDCYHCYKNKKYPDCNCICLEDVKQLLEKKESEISAVVIEPLVLGAGGMIIYPVLYLQKLSQLLRKYKVHLILDEVACGFGRTGKMFAFQWANEQNKNFNFKFEFDFICLSKGLSAGYLPLGLTLTTDKVFDAFYSDYKMKKTFFHGHTFTGNSLSISVSLESLRIFQEQDIINKMQPNIMFFQTELKKLSQFKIVDNIRDIGFIGAFDIVKNKDTKQIFDFEDRIGYKIYQQGLKNNLILRPLGNVIYLWLPLIINKKQISDIINKLIKTLTDIQEQYYQIKQ